MNLTDLGPIESQLAAPNNNKGNEPARNFNN